MAVCTTTGRPIVREYISKAAKAVIAGFGVDGYALAITGIAGLLGAKQKN